VAVPLSSSNVNGLGGGSVAVAGVQGAAVQLTGGRTIARPINYVNNSTSSNVVFGGFNFEVEMDNLSGTNTWSGAITTSSDA